MFCKFCGKQIREGASFCPSCGRNLSTGELRKKEISFRFANKKTRVLLLAVIIGLVLVCVLINGNKANSIVGVWMNGTDRIVFTKDGEYQNDSNYGTYTIWDDKTLEIAYGDYSFKNGVDEFYWGDEAKDDMEYWYMSGGKLYMWGREYIKQ